MDILSKASTAENSILNMKKALKSVSCKYTLSKVLHPLLNCFSVNLKSHEAPNKIYTNGKGVNELSCEASALGEYIERLQTNNFFTEYYLQNRVFYPDQKAFDDINECLTSELLKFYNPQEELEFEDFLDFNTDEKDKIICLPFENDTSSNSKKPVYFPINILHNLYVSNGLATGNTPLEAKIQALSECLERYVKIKIIKQGYSLPEIPSQILKQFEKLNQDIKSLQDMGYIIKALDASLDGAFPVVAISLINPTTNSLFVSFGSHPILEVALERTMTELMQGREVKDLNAFEKPSFNTSLIDDNFNIESHFIDSNGKINFTFLSSKKSFDYALWQYNGKNQDDEYEYLKNIITKMKKEIYVRQYDYLGFCSCQVIIPNLSEVYPIEDMIYNNANTGKELREYVLTYENSDDLQDILDNIEHISDDIDVAKYIGVIFKNDFTVGDFKAQIYLIQKDFHSAVGYFELSSKPIAYLLAQLCHIYIACDDKLILDDYQESLCDVFGENSLKNALEIFSNKIKFIDISFDDEYLSILDLYDRLGEAKTR